MWTDGLCMKTGTPMAAGERPSSIDVDVEPKDRAPCTNKNPKFKKYSKIFMNRDMERLIMESVLCKQVAQDTQDIKTKARS